MRDADNRYWFKSLFKAISIQSLGNMSAQLIHFASLPIIARIYGPEAFAPYGSILALAAILYLSLAFGMDLALLTARATSRRLLLSILSVSAFLSGITAMLISWIFFGYSLGLVLAAGLTVWLVNWGLVLAQWAILHERHAHLALLRAVQAVVFAGMAALLGLFNPAPESLLIAACIGAIAVIFMLFDRQRLIRLSLRRFQFALRRHWHFFWPSWPGRFVDLLGMRGPAVSAVLLFGSTQAGLFLMTMRVLEVPSRLLTSAVGSVVLMRLAKRDGPRLMPVVIIMIGQAVGAALFFGPLYLALPWAVPVVLGAQWLGVLPLAEALVFMLAVQFVISPLSTIMLLNGHPGRSFVWQLGYVTAIGATLLAAWIQQQNVDVFVVWFSIVTCLCYLVYAALILQSCWRFDKTEEK